MHQDIERKKREAMARRKMCETILYENINKTCDKVKCHALKYNFSTFYRSMLEYTKWAAL